MNANEKTPHITVNENPFQLAVEPNQTLLEVIRENLGLTGTKAGCLPGDYGAATVLLDGNPVNSCLVPAVQAHGKQITTMKVLKLRRDFIPSRAPLWRRGPSTADTSPLE